MPEATKPGPDSQPLVGASEAAEIMNVELSTFSHLRRREEQTEGSKFPKPMATLRCGPIWKTADIKRFATRYVAPRPGPKPAPATSAPAKPTKAAAKAQAKPVAKKAAAKTAPAIKVVATAKANDNATLNGKPVAKKAGARRVVKKVPAAV